MTDAQQYEYIELSDNSKLPPGVAYWGVAACDRREKDVNGFIECFGVMPRRVYKTYGPRGTYVMPKPDEYQPDTREGYDGSGQPPT